MKKLLLLLVLFSGFSLNQAAAQFCVPNKTLVDSVVGVNVLFPPPYDTVTMMGGFEDTACIGVYFETDLQVVIPETIDFNGTTLPLISIEITAVTGLPDGLNFACSPDPCFWKPTDTVACVNIYGIAAEGNVSGDFKLGIEGSANAGFTIPLSLLLNQTPGGYFIYLREQTETNCQGVATENLLAQSMHITSKPNPFSDLAEIQIGSDISGTFNFQVINMLGGVEHTEKVDIIAGNNTLNFDGSHLAEGVYFYSISSPLGQLTGKMMVNR